MLQLFFYKLYLVNNCSADVLDHADVLAALCGEISATIDARSVARNMFQCNALTLKELQSILCKRSESVKAAEQLLSILMKQSGNVYSCFLDSLKATGQRHVYEDIVSGSYRGTPLLCSRISRPTVTDDLYTHDTSTVHTIRIKPSRFPRIWKVGEWQKCRESPVYQCNRGKYSFYRATLCVSAVFSIGRWPSVWLIRSDTVKMWRNPANVTHRQLLSTDQIRRRSTALTWSRWGCRRLADNIWLLAHDNNNNIVKIPDGWSYRQTSFSFR